jgi:hypothetical protein
MHTTAALAADYLSVKAEAERLAERGEQLRQALLARMTSEGQSAVTVTGRGRVVLVKGSTKSQVDVKACAVRIGELAGELRALGREADDSLPLGVVTTHDTVRVVWPRRPSAGK